MRNLTLRHIGNERAVVIIFGAIVEIPFERVTEYAETGGAAEIVGLPGW